jgi:two-component system sensor histidine kinase RegB
MPRPLRRNVEYAAGHKNMLQLIELRWIAVIGQVTTIAAAILIFDVNLPLVHMLQVLACLIAFNIASHLRWHENRWSPTASCSWRCWWTWPA